MRNVSVRSGCAIRRFMKSFFLFLACGDFGRMFDNSFSACAFFVFCFCLFVCFFEVKISSRTLIPLFCQDQSTVAQRTETTVTEIFPDELRVSSFPGWFPHYARTAA